MSLKSIVRSTVFYTVLGFLPVASQVILAPLFTKYLTPYQYGVINLVNIFGAYAAVFIGFGFESAFSIFYFYYYKRPLWLARLISTVILSVIFFAFFVFLISIFFGNWIFSLFGGDESFQFATFGIPALIIFLTTVCISILQYFFRNEENLQYYTIVSLTFFILIVAGQLIGLLLEKNAAGVVFGRMCGACLTLIGILIYIFRKYRLTFNRSIFKKCLSYGYPMAIYGLIWVAFENMDRIAIEKNFGKGSLGIYGFAIIITSVLELVRISFVTAISPSIYKIIEDLSEKSRNTVSYTIRFFSASTANALCLLLAIACPVVYIFINKNFHASLLFLPFLFMAMIPRIYFSFFAMPLFYFGKTKALAVINLISLLMGYAYLKTVGSSWGIFGVCSIAIIVKMSQCAGTYIYLKYISDLKVKFGFSTLGKDNVIILLTTICLLIAMFLAVNYPDYIYLINTLPLVAVIYSMILYQRQIKMQIAGGFQKLKYFFQKDN